jgi:outer membrane immunogenic protein
VKFLFAIFTVILTLTFPCFATDDAVVPPDMNTFSWNGGYLGVQLGYDWVSVDDHFPAAPDIEFDGHISDATSGIFGGWNWQSGSLVFGADGSFDLSAVDDTITVPVGPDSSDRLNTEYNWKSAVRGRLGYAIGKFLPYVAAGGAFSDVSIEMQNDGDTFLSETETLAGWTIGAGVDVAFTNNLIGRLEYRYADYGSVDYTVGGGSGSIEFDSSSISAGLAYKF